MQQSSLFINFQSVTKIMTVGLHDCLLNRLFRRRSKETPKLCVTGLYAGKSPGTGEFPAQMVSNAEHVSIWWRHHVTLKMQMNASLMYMSNLSNLFNCVPTKIPTKHEWYGHVLFLPISYQCGNNIMSNQYWIVFKRWGWWLLLTLYFVVW